MYPHISEKLLCKVSDFVWLDHVRPNLLTSTDSMI